MFDVRDPLLEEVATPSGSLGEEGYGVLRVGVLAEHQHSGLRIDLPQSSRRPYPLVGLGRRHPDVGEQHVGPVILDSLYKRVEVITHRNQLQVRLALDQAPHTLADQIVVLGEHHANGHTERIGVLLPAALAKGSAGVTTSAGSKSSNTRFSAAMGHVLATPRAVYPGGGSTTRVSLGRTLAGRKAKRDDFTTG